MSKSSREETRAALRAIGGTLFYSDNECDWFTVHERHEQALYLIRPELRFRTQLNHTNADGGFVVWYSHPYESRRDAIKSALRELPDVPANAIAIGILRSAL